MSDKARELLERALELFEYDPTSHTGLRYKIDHYPRHKGSTAGGKASRGKYYEVVVADRKRVRAHWIVWALHHGSFPENQIDHINGNGLDNRIENLRQVDSSQNNWNRSIETSSKTGIKNIYFNESSNTYRVEIFKFRKHINVGSFKTLEEAKKAAEQAREKHHGNYTRKTA